MFAGNLYNELNVKCFFNNFPFIPKPNEMMGGLNTYALFLSHFPFDSALAPKLKKHRKVSEYFIKELDK